MIETQKKIEGIVASYKQFYPEEYLALCRQIIVFRDTMKNQYGDMTKQMDMVERPLYDISETLSNLIMQMLSEPELEYYKSLKGAHWFAKKYPEFRTTYKV